MKTYCEPVFVAPFGNVTTISVVGFHVEVAFAHIPPTTFQELLLIPFNLHEILRFEILRSEKYFCH